MRKELLFGLGLTMLVPAMAEGTEPIKLTDFYSKKISGDGSVIFSQTWDEIKMYKVDEKETTDFDFFQLGNGNCISKDGKIAVGSTEMDEAVMIFNGEQKIFYDLKEEYALVSFHGITPDGSRMCGLISNNATGTETMYRPAYWEVGSDGTLSDPNFLPYPAKDWQGLEVQHCSAVWISEDGKTILGQVIDWSGMDLYPIVYTQDASGEWSYSLPTESLINPNKLPLPVYPGDFDVEPPYFEDYMTAEEAEKYNEALEAYYTQDWSADELLPYPSETDYMSEEERTAYEAACAEYDEKADAYNEKVNAYFEAKGKIEEESVFFQQNSMTLSADGKMIALNSVKSVENDDPLSWSPWKDVYSTYLVDLETEAIKEIAAPGEDVSAGPEKFLADGSLLSNSPMGSTDGAFILEAGADEYIPFINALGAKNPAGAAWLKENFTVDIEAGYDADNDETLYEKKALTGIVSISDDWSVITGGVEAYMYAVEDDDPMYESYVITSEKSGVSNVAADAKLVDKKYYDINGFEVKNPENGIYVERSVYSDGTVITAKKAIK